MKGIETETKVGLAIIVAFLVLLLGDMFLRGVSVGKEGYVLKTRLRNVAGLMQGNRVTVMGMEVGRVGKMSLQGEEVVVLLRIDSDLQLPLDSMARVRSSGLFGGKEVAIEPGQSFETLKNGDYIPGVYESPLSALTSTVGPIGEDLMVLLERLRSTINQETQGNIRESLSDLRDFTRKLKENGETLDTILVHLEKLSSGLKGEDIEATLSSLREATKDLAQVVSSWEAIAGRMEEGKGTLGKLSQDEALYENLKSLSQDLDSLVRDIQQNPKRYFKFSIF